MTPTLILELTLASTVVCVLLAMAAVTALATWTSVTQRPAQMERLAQSPTCILWFRSTSMLVSACQVTRVLIVPSTSPSAIRSPVPTADLASNLLLAFSLASVRWVGTAVHASLTLTNVHLHHAKTEEYVQRLYIAYTVAVVPSEVDGLGKTVKLTTTSVGLGHVRMVASALTATPNVQQSGWCTVRYPGPACLRQNPLLVMHWPWTSAHCPSPALLVKH